MSAAFAEELVRAGLEHDIALFVDDQPADVERDHLTIDDQLERQPEERDCPVEGVAEWLGVGDGDLGAVGRREGRASDNEQREHPDAVGGHERLLHDLVIERDRDLGAALLAQELIDEGVFEMTAEGQDPPANRSDREVEGATVVRQLRLAGVLGVERCGHDQVGGSGRGPEDDCRRVGRAADQGQAAVRLDPVDEGDRQEVGRFVLGHE